VAEAWKIGRRKIDDGALLVVAKDDRKLRIEVGYGLEGALTDVTASRIIGEIIVPRFRSGDFAGGISAGVDRIVAVIDGEPLPAPQPQQSWSLPDKVGDAFPFIVFGVIALSGFLRMTLGGLVGSAATGGIVGLLAWFILGSLALSFIAAAIAFVFTLFGGSFASSNGRTGWSGGGGSFSGSSSSDSGGFSGGGGSFGGGGASGSW
jgi:uncharacterized protein